MLDQIGPCEAPGGMASGNVVQSSSHTAGFGGSGFVCWSQFLSGCRLLKGQPGSFWSVLLRIGSGKTSSVYLRISGRCRQVDDKSSFPTSLVSGLGVGVTPTP